jgi:hypothetical protein
MFRETTPWILLSSHFNFLELSFIHVGLNGIIVDLHQLNNVSYLTLDDQFDGKTSSYNIYFLGNGIFMYFLRALWGILVGKTH